MLPLEDRDTRAIAVAVASPVSRLGEREDREGPASGRDRPFALVGRNPGVVRGVVTCGVVVRRVVWCAMV